MIRKRLLTAALCMVLCLASMSVSNTWDRVSGFSVISYAAESEETPEETAPAAEVPETGESAQSEAPVETNQEETAETVVLEKETSADSQANTEDNSETGNTEESESSENTDESSGSSEESETSEKDEASMTEEDTELSEGIALGMLLDDEDEAGEGIGNVLRDDKPFPGETSEDGIEDEELEDASDSPYKTNEELLKHQKIVIPPNIELEFRFTQVEADYAIVSNRNGAKIYESKSTDATEVGELDYYGYCYILESKNDGWYYAESGNVRGFIKDEDTVSGETAKRIYNVKGEDSLSTAHLLVARTENDAYDYTHTTVQEVMEEKCYALASGETNIYEQRKDSSRVIGVLQDQALCYVLADGDKDWVFVESGDARGFVKANKLIQGKKADKKVSEVGENNLPKAEVKVEPQDNKACYYTLTSVKEASQSAKTREAMVNFALQFVGNPYVWGGTSLTNGADCSGFVQSVYSYFGYSLPRVACDQAVYGMQIPIESAAPGDLIFYAKNGYVHHVSMYIGNGQVVHAANSRVGIITSGITGGAVWATRVISD